MECDVKDKNIRREGRRRIEWALRRMPVLELIRKRFAKKKPLRKVKISGCLHITTETAVLAVTLQQAGAWVRLCASNPLSTQDDVAASLVADFGIEVFAIKGENRSTYYKHIRQVLAFKPHITLDDGADLVSTLHREKHSSYPLGGTEETTTGVIRLKALQKEGKLRYPIIAVNDAYTKHLFDNRYGTGQSTLDGIVRATNRLIAGTTFVVCGYGWCGKGIAARARGLGANVTVCETDPLRALEAVMDGYRVEPIKKAVKTGDIFVTATGDISVIRKEHFAVMKDKALLANAGHFNVEIDLKGLDEMAKTKRQIKPLITEYVLNQSRRHSKKLYVLGEGRLVNLACAEGHPAEVMDMSFANQALSCEYIYTHSRGLECKVYGVPEKIDKKIACLKLKSLGITVDTLTPVQKEYLTSWEAGT